MFAKGKELLCICKIGTTIRNLSTYITNIPIYLCILKWRWSKLGKKNAYKIDIYTIGRYFSNHIVLFLPLQMENREGKKEYKKLFFIDYEQKKLKNLCVFS